MTLRIQNNIAAMNAHRQLTQTSVQMTKSLERLSSGYRINKAADDAAGLAISSSFRADIASYKVASRNVAEANAMAQVAEGAYDQVNNMLVRLKELATQASSANAGSNLDKINSEGNALINEIDRIAQGTEYAGTKLLNGSYGSTGVSISAGGSTSNIDLLGFVSASGLVADTMYHIITDFGAPLAYDVTVTATIGGSLKSETVNISAPVDGNNQILEFESLGFSMTIFNDPWLSISDFDILGDSGTPSYFQIGAKNSSNDRITFNLDAVTSENLGISDNQMQNATDAQDFLASIDSAIDILNGARGGIGAVQNRLGYAAANLSTTIENVQAAESVIRDVDMASEMTSFTKTQILIQAGTSMLAQANMAPQNILSLIG